MTIAHRIFRRVKSLPGYLQAEVLEFVEYVTNQSRRREEASADAEWQEFSLSQALRDIDDESEPAYLESDIKHRFE